MAFLAAFVWACYSVLVKKIGSFGMSVIQSTRHIFFYGIFFMIIPVFLMGFEWGLERFRNPVYLGNMLFLGIGASALLFCDVEFSGKALGAVRTAVLFIPFSCRNNYCICSCFRRENNGCISNWGSIGFCRTYFIG